MLLEADGTINVSNHSLKFICECDTRAVLYALGYRDSVGEMAIMKCGVAMHEGLADFFINGNKQLAIAKFTSHYRTWSDKNVPQIDAYAYDNVVRVLANWLDKNPLEKLPFTVIPEFVECSFELPLLENGKIKFNGRPDAVVRHKTKDQIFIVDHKTTGYISDDFVRSFTLDPQMRGYIWMAREHGLNVTGAIINAIEIKKLSDSSSECPQHKMPRKDCALRHLAYQMIPVKYNDELIDEWYKTTVAESLKLRDLLDKTPKIEYIKRQRMQGTFHRGACINCGFFDFCAQGRNPELANKLLFKVKKK